MSKPHAPYVEVGGEHAPFLPGGGGGGGGLSEAEVIALIEARRSPKGAAGGALAGTYPNPTIAPLEYLALEAVNANLAIAGEPFATVTPGVALDPVGYVRARGAYKPTVEIAAKGVLFTIPAACRPEHQRGQVLSVSLASTTTSLLIMANGEVQTLLALKVTHVLDLGQLLYPKAG
jgi:hypothetical protein